MNTAAPEHHIALIRALHASWSDNDPEILPSLFVADGVHEDVPYGISVSGTDALRDYSARMKKHNVALEQKILHCDATATTGVAEWHLTHVFAGNFDGVDCSGRRVRIKGLSVYEFRDGLIARSTDYWNYMEMVHAMEVIPREIRSYRTA